MYEGLVELFERNLQQLTTEKNPIKKAAKGIHLCHETLHRLKEQVPKDTFGSIAEEIKFFKEVQPAVQSKLIYFDHINSYELRKPRAGTSFQIRFLEKEMKQVNKFFFRVADFVQYMELGQTYFDRQFFTRTTKGFPFMPVDTSYYDPEFSTAHSILWSKVQGLNSYIQYLRKEMMKVRLDRPAIPNNNRLQWTGSKSALIELIYALYSNGVINKGAADLRTLTSSFEDFFNVQLDHVYKTYCEIKGRKGSRTKFLEELIFDLEQKISREDRYVEMNVGRDQQRKSS